MLNPRWKDRYDPKDYGDWQRMEATTPPFFELSFSTINRLLDKYFRTNSGYELGPTKNWYQRKEILAKTMSELEKAVCHDQDECARLWHERQLAEESIDAKLEREKGMRESKISSREVIMNKISARDTAPVAPIFDSTTASEAVAAIKSGVKAPVVSIQASSLGGPENISIMIAIGLDPKESWANGIFENSRYIRLHLYKNGVLESFVNTTGAKFRKTRAKSVDDVVAKLNAYVDVAKMEQAG